MLCPSCKKENLTTAKFCVNCGTKFNQQQKESELKIIQRGLSKKSIKVDKKMGQIGSASIYVGEHIELNKTVVIRILREEYTNNPEIKDMFWHGVSIAQKINAPHIVKIYDVGEIDKRPYAVMQHAELGPLSLLLKNNYGHFGMPIEEAFSYTIKILKGLQVIHDFGIVHLNIKPSSILILSDGEPIISNFGIATSIDNYKNKDSSQTTSTEDRVNRLVGTVHYMSPERCRLSSNIDHRSDIYSTGILLYELLTGRPPFEGDTHSILYKHLNDGLPDITDNLLAQGLNSLRSGKENIYEISKKIQAILDKACSKGKSRRYKAAKDFANELGDFLAKSKEIHKQKRKSQKTIPLGYNADRVEENEDRLGITSSVLSFARLLSSRTLQPPLSVGLFGNWGSGKSFFIHKLRQEIDRLSSFAKSELDNGKEIQEIPYYSRIVQIEFNAWHYVESNLWASMVEHLFTHLKISGETVDEVRNRRDFLIKQIEAEKSGLLELENNHKTLEKEIEKAQTEIENERKKQKEVLTSLVKNKLDKLSDEQIKKYIKPDNVKKWFEYSGLKYNEKEPLPSQLYRLYEETNQFKNLPIVEKLKKRSGMYLYFAGLVLLVGIGIFLFFLTKKYDVAGLLGGISSLIASILAFGKKLKTWTETYLNWLPDYFQKVKEAIPELEEEIKKAEEESQARLNSLEKKKNEYNQRYHTIQEKINALNNELESTTHGDYLAQFIQERIGTNDYKQHLGILSLIRRDFEKLSQFLCNYNRELEKGTESLKDNPYMINRIVIYIDDLDRCPPEKVVQVLQAVHLLLSFEAFVVIVAVDSRWVSQSLRIGYKELFGEDISVDIDGDGFPDIFRPTPHDYLEKIFQIPFWLYPMNIEGRRNLLNSLMRPNYEWNEDTNSKKRIEKKIASTGDKEVPTKRIVSIQNQNRQNLANEPYYEQFIIKKAENEFSLKVAPILGQSPRALKRFVNSYRLIKVGLNELQWSIYFTDIHPKTGQKNTKGTVQNYQAVMFLLALITGMPSASRLFFRTLRAQSVADIRELLNRIDVKKDEEDGWKIFGVYANKLTLEKQIEQENVGLKDENSINVDSEIQLYNMQLELRQFTNWLDELGSIVWMDVDMEQLRYWDPYVSRYSFRVEPVDIEYG